MCRDQHRQVRVDEFPLSLICILGKSCGRVTFMTSTPKKSKLEIANDLYKFAYEVKKQKFSEQNPQLTTLELEKKTALYLNQIKKG